MVSQISRGAEIRREKENTHMVKPPSADPGAAGERRRDAGQEGRVAVRAGGRQPATGGEDRQGLGDRRRTRRGEMGRRAVLVELSSSRGRGLCPAAPAPSVPHRSPRQCCPHPHASGLAAALCSALPLLLRSLCTQVKAVVNPGHATELSSPNGDCCRCCCRARAGCEQLVG